MKEKIKNKDLLSTNDLRRDILEVAESGLQAIDTQNILEKSVELKENNLEISGQTYNLDDHNRVFLFGFGKSACNAAGVLEEILGDKIDGGAVVGLEDKACRNVEIFVGTHPTPSEINVEASKKIESLANDLTENDLALVIVSGGGSALLCSEREYRQSKKLYDDFLKVGGDIHELNTIRKHISDLKGGGLAKALYPATVCSLIFSDVPGDHADMVASGPTFKDDSTMEDAERILDKYDLKDYDLEETPMENKFFEKVTNLTVSSNELALEAMKEKALSLGYDANIISDELSGEARLVGKDLMKKLHDMPTKSLNLYGGETVVYVEGEGRGGRNQELALGALPEIAKGEIILSLASDGHDNSDHAGALCDNLTKEKVRAMNLSVEEYLKENNSYDFFEKTGDYLETGLTGSNVADLIITIKN